MPGLTNRQQLLRQIDALSFSIIDLTQFIDTHPYHTEAILKLQQYNTEKTNYGKYFINNKNATRLIRLAALRKDYFD